MVWGWLFSDVVFYSLCLMRSVINLSLAGLLSKFWGRSPVNKLCSYERVYKKNPSSYLSFFQVTVACKLEGNHKIEF